MSRKETTMSDDMQSQDSTGVKVSKEIYLLLQDLGASALRGYVKGAPVHLTAGWACLSEVGQHHVRGWTAICLVGREGKEIIECLKSRLVPASVCPVCHGRGVHDGCDTCQDIGFVPAM